MTAGWVDLIAEVLRGTPKLPGALCRLRAGLFDGENDDDAHQAAELCDRCPAREPCTAWANTLRHNQIDGVIAGQHRIWISQVVATRGVHRRVVHQGADKHWSAPAVGYFKCRCLPRWPVTILV